MTSNRDIRRIAMPLVAIAGVALCVRAQGPIGGGPLPEDDGEFIYQVASALPAFDRDVSSSLEIGEDLFFGGSNRVLTDLTFNYKSDYARDKGMIVTVYAEGGPDANGLFIPGTKLLERPVDVRVGTGIGNVALAYGSVGAFPDRVVVTVRFVDVPQGGNISLVARETTPVIGSTRPGYLERTGPGDQDWAVRPLTDNSGNQVNFLLGVKAAPIPEPSTVALTIAGVGMLWLASRGRSSRQVS